jgi:hypothetical protein
MKKWLIFALLILAVFGCRKKRKAVDNGDGTVGVNGGTTSTIPGKPNLITPAQNSICISGIIVSDSESQVLFTWSGTENTNSYDLVLKNLLTNTSKTINVTDTQAWAQLLRNTPYSWYVSAKQTTSTTTTQSDNWKFYNSGAGVVTYAPFPAEIVAPTYGQIVTAVDGKIDLSWKGSSADSNITGYNVSLGTTTDPPVIKNGVTDTFLNDVVVAANTVYHWRVVTVDANGNYTDSGLYQFKTQ